MFRRRRSRLDEEVASHIAEETADNIARGMAPDVARAAAMRTFGNVEAAKEAVRERHPWYWLDTFSQDVGFAFRLIVRNPGLSATIVGTLTVGIGLNVSIFTLVDAYLLRPLVRSEPETLINVFPKYSGEYDLRYSDGGMSQPDYVRLRDAAQSLAALAGHRQMSVTLSGPESGNISAGLVTCNITDVARPEPPLAGRYLSAGDCNAADLARPAVITEAAWRSRFGSAADIVGRTIHLNRLPFTVVGVASSLGFPTAANAEVWVPYSLLDALRPSENFFADPRAQWLNVTGRRKPDYSLRQVEEELRAIARHADEVVPGRRTTLTVTDGALINNPDMRGRTRVLVAVTLGTATVLLALACVNVTTLLLSRSAARQREVAIRLSLGAGRVRLFRQWLTEGLVLGALAGTASLLVVHYAPAALWQAIVGTPAAFPLTLNWRVLLYAGTVAGITGLIAGLFPSIDSMRPDVSDILKGSSAAVTPGRRRARLRGALVAVQIALSLLLLVQVALVTRMQQRYLSYDPGFETQQVLNVTFASVQTGFSPPVSFYQEVESRLDAMPGIVGTTFAAIAPWAGRNSTTVLEVDGRPIPIPPTILADPARRPVDPDYFSTLDLRMLRGRAFTRAELSSSGSVVPVVISEAMAARYWPGQDPLGREFRLGNRRQTLPRSPVAHVVVGVCRDVQSVRYLEDDGPFYYVPLNVEQRRPAYMFVRVEGDPNGPAAAIREIVRDVDPQMAVTVATLASSAERLGQQLKPLMLIGSVAGLLALALALTGVYAVASFSVGQRIREIGIRTALGARRSDVMMLIFRSGVGPVAAGLVTGLGLALMAAAVMESMIVGVNPRDPLTLTFVALLLLGAALGAIWIPARRAAALDPLVSLRYE